MCEVNTILLHYELKSFIVKSYSFQKLTKIISESHRKKNREILCSKQTKMSKCMREQQLITPTSSDYD